MTNPSINFIPNDEFESTSENDFAEIDFELYKQEETPPIPPDHRVVAESFMNAVAQCRLLTFEGEQYLFKKLNFLRFRAHALQVTLKNDRKGRRTQKEIDRLLNEANEVREEIVRANLRLVISISRKMSKSTEECDEYVAESNAILLNAIDKFDYSRGYRFGTYATHALQRHLYRFMEKRNKRRGIEASQDMTTLQPEAVPITNDELTGKETIEAFKLIVSKMQEVLDEREEFIVRKRFGIDDQSGIKSIRLIGEELGISKERTRQILQKSIEKLAKVAKPVESLFIHS